MAIADEWRNNHGAEAVRLVTRIRSRARESVAEYRKWTAQANQLEAGGAPTDVVIAGPPPVTRSEAVAKIRARAKALLEDATNRPKRIREMLNEKRRVYELANGAGTYTAYLTSCLTAAGGRVSFAQLNAELTALENAAATFFTERGAGKTLDEIATKVETDWKYETQDQVTGPLLRDPVSYTPQPL